MITDLKPYPAMKDSGVPWLGDVPEHWNVRRGKWLFRSKKEINTDRRYDNILSLTLRGVVNNDPDDPEGLVPTDYSTYQFFAKGDLVFKLIDLENLRTSRVGHVHEDGIMSPAYIRLTATHHGNQHFFYLQYLDLYQRFVFNQLGAGVRATLGAKDLLELSVLVPSGVEQESIVRFLDHMDRRIRHYIRAKQKLIKLLEEQKQAIIHRAVTHGLDPNVRLKPSGVEWLGVVPEHWKVLRLKFVAAKIVDCLHATPKYDEKGGFPAIRTADISPGKVHLSSARHVGSDEYNRWVERLEPKPGDILYSREGERFGIAACVPEGARLCISQRMMVFRVRLEYNPVYVMWLLNSNQVYAQACQDVMGATAPHVNVSTIRNYFLAIPSRAEQDSLVAEIEDSTSGFTNVIAKEESEISLLREYRTRLIADVVTGKLDVREAAAHLPDEINEPEPFEDGNAIAEGEDEAESVNVDEATEEIEA